ncbi:hypothetical protein [Corticicoccus populi]|uniref:Uncharacterized protein n=1 Tax=Corticicoccus populi TaxID=1812821 RepID=A0ABW5WU90_9STAP
MEFLEDENGQQQVIDLIHDIVTKAQTDKNYREMAKRIAQVFQHLKTTGVPPEHLSTINAKSTDGFTITLVDIVKELTEYKPLLETRINWKPVGAFRAIFFYEEDSRGNQIIYYTKAVIKTSTFSQDFEDIAAESEKMMKEFYTN